MNKILTKVATLALGAAMAVGVGVAVGSKKVSEVKAADDIEITFPGSPSQKTSAYNKTFTMTVGGVQFSFANWNNGSDSDSWDAIRGGQKKSAWTGTITSGVIANTVDKVEVNITSISNSTGSKLEVASDASFTQNVQTIDHGSITATGKATFTVPNQVENSYYRLTFNQSAKANGSIRLDSVKYYAGASTTNPAITLNPSNLSFMSNGSSQSITVVPNDQFTGTPTISVNGTPSYVNCSVDGLIITVSPKAVGTESITVNAVNNTEQASATLSVEVIDAHGHTEDDPFSVAEVRSLIDKDTSKTHSSVYVEGIISQVDSFDSKYSSITYWISDDGTTTNQFECYSGKGIGSADFSSVNDVEVGASVVVCGDAKYYSGTYEFNYNNFLVSYTAPTSSPLSSISLSGTHQTTFDVGDTFSHDGLIVTAHYEDSTSKTVTPTSVSTPDMSSAGQKTVTVSYTENEVSKSAEYTITVNAVTLYTMSFNPGSGTGTMESVQVKEGADYTLPTCTFTAPAGMTFDAWTYIGTRMTQVTDVHDDYEFTAIWKDAPKVDTVTYDFSSEIPSEWVASLDKTTTDTSLGRGVGWGSAKGTITLTLDNDKMVTSVVVTASTNNAGNTVAVSVGGNAYGDAKEIASGTDHKNQEYTFDGSSSGNITVTLEDTAKTVWVLSIAVTAESSGSKVLESISVADPKTAYEVGDEFVKPTTTAHYDDETTGNITNKATFTGYDMNVAGEYTVNVSYTEGEVEKTTSYDIVVSEPAPVVVANYKKVKTNLADYSGNYLIVCESKNVAFDGSLATLDAVGNNQSVSISEEVINASSAYEFTVAAKTGGYSVRSASKKYIGSTTTSNELKTSDTDDYTNGISYSAGVSEIVCNDHYLRYNDASNQNRFRFFTNQNQKAISLFVKVANDAEAFALDILNLTTEVCSAEGEHAAGDFATAWSTLTTKYDSVVNKDLLVNGDADANGTFFAEALARYDILVAKYGLNPFMHERVSNLAYIPNYQYNIDSSSSITIIVIVAVASMTLLGVTLVLRKRKHQ